MTTITKQIEIELVECASCHLLFGIETAHLNRLRKSAENFWCPSGHTNWYGESETSKLSRRLKSAEESKIYWQGVAETERHAKNGMKGQYQKTKNELRRTQERIENGVCPCCHRQFVSLARHMKSQHPEFGEAA